VTELPGSWWFLLQDMLDGSILLKRLYWGIQQTDWIALGLLLT